MYTLFGGFAGIIWPCVAPVGAEVVGLQLLPSGMELYPSYDLRGTLTLQPSIVHLLACSGLTSDLVRFLTSSSSILSQIVNHPL